MIDGFVTLNGQQRRATKYDDGQVWFAPKKESARSKWTLAGAKTAKTFKPGRWNT